MALKIVGAHCNIQFIEDFDPDSRTISAYIGIHPSVYNDEEEDFPPMFGMADSDVFFQAETIADFAEHFIPNGKGDFVILSVDSFYYVDENTKWND